jgi:ParB family chromosome partitioning protein
VEWPENRVTAYYLEGQEELLHESLAVLGQQQPLVVVQVGEQFFGVDGLHRWQAAQARGDETIPAVVTQGGERDVLLRNLVLNSLRGRTKASEMVAVVKELREDQGMSIEELEAALGHSRKWVEDLIFVSEAVAPVRQALDDELLTLGHAVALAEIKDQETQERLCGQQLIYRWSIKELRDHIKSTLRVRAEADGATPQPQAAPAALVACKYCHDTPAPELIVTVPICASCSGLLVDARRTPKAEG